MATFTTGATITADFTTPTYGGTFFGGSLSATTSMITLTLGSYTLEISGSFTLSGPNPVSGAVSSFVLKDSGTTIQSITSLAGLDWSSLAPLRGAVNVDGLNSLLFAGDDIITGSNNADYLRGYDGNDTIYGGADMDTIQGGDGNDVLYGEANTDHLFGNDGDDILHGQLHEDFLRGGAGADSLYGEDGNDTLESDDGDDYLIGGLAADYIDGGNGFDTAKYDDHTSGVIVDLSNNVAFTATGNDELYNIEGVVGSDYADTITGSAGDNSLYGEDGNDALVGGIGIDSLYGGDGTDVLDGGVGDDFLYGGAGDFDLLNGDAGNDYLDGGAGAQDRAYYRGDVAGITVDMSLATGQVTDGWGGQDTLVDIEEIWGSNHDDMFSGSSGTDLFAGWDGNDTMEGFGGGDALSGHDGNDFLYGGVGNDGLNGDDGDDELTGGADGDFLSGGAGDDTFIFDIGSGADHIFDFVAGAATDDVIDVSDYGFANYVALSSNFYTSGGGADTFIDLGGGNSIYLFGVAVASLHADDFII